MITIYNSLSQNKEPLKPIEAKHVKLYVCGITAYDYSHIGHARMFIVFDVVVRYLRAQGFKVTYVRNITDIDDKIINRSREQNISWQQLVETFVEAAHEDERALNILPPDFEPRATEYIPQMLEMIQQLFDKGHAYQAKNGDVYYRVQSFPEYGKLSHQDLEGLRAGARIEITEAKADPLDFVLWKSAKPGEPAWPSPWGEGRPGWHMECSVMSSVILGQPFDIHGGGFDLQFPHHENEIAQSEGAHECTFANLWMHNGFVQVNQEKMSKSLGNFFVIREALVKYHPEVLRHFMISSHYRSAVNYSEEALTQSKAALSRLYNALRDVDCSKTSASSNTIFEKKFVEAMNDDFNTPIAMSVLFELAHEIQKKRAQPEEAAHDAALLKKLGQTLGLLYDAPESFLKGKASESDDQNINLLVKERENARLNKNWQRADEIRDQLLALGVTLEDAEGKTIWRR